MPYAASTLTTIRQRVLRELDCGQIIPNAKFSALTTGSITSADLMQDTNVGGTEWQARRAVIFRPGSATAADNVRFAGALTNSSGLLAHTGANYADTTIGAEIVEIWFDGIRPDLEILDGINRALEFTLFSSMEMLSHLSDNDGGMSSTATTAFTATNTTMTKVTTAFKVPWGIRALRNVNTSANGYAQTTTIPITQNRPFTAFAIAAAAISSATMSAYDVTNSAVMGNTVTSAEIEPQLLHHPWDNSTTTTKQMALQLSGASATADVAWDAVGIYKLDTLRMNLPSYISEDFKAPFIFQGRPEYVSTTAYVYPAQSLVFTPLVEGRDYELIFNQADANPYAVQFSSSNWYDWPLFVQIRRPYLDLTTSSAGLTAETDTTPAPLHELIPRIKLDLIDRVFKPRQPNVTKWDTLRGIAVQELASALASRPIQRLSNPRPRWGGLVRV